MSKQKVDRSRKPLATVDANGYMLPFTDNHLSYIKLMELKGVTYIWTQEELQKACEANSKAMRDDDAMRVVHGDVLPAIILPEYREPIDVESLRGSIRQTYFASAVR